MVKVGTKKQGQDGKSFRHALEERSIGGDRFRFSEDQWIGGTLKDHFFFFLEIKSANVVL